MKCRLCLKSDVTNGENIINSQLKCSDLTLIESLYWVFGVEVDISDPYSKIICEHCQNIVRYVGTYRSLYQKNQLILEGKLDYRDADEGLMCQDINTPSLNNFDKNIAHQSNATILWNYFDNTSHNTYKQYDESETEDDINNLFDSMNCLSLDFVKQLSLYDENYCVLENIFEKTGQLSKENKPVEVVAKIENEYVDNRVEIAKIHKYTEKEVKSFALSDETELNKKGQMVCSESNDKIKENKTEHMRKMRERLSSTLHKIEQIKAERRLREGSDITLPKNEGEGEISEINSCDSLCNKKAHQKSTGNDSVKSDNPERDETEKTHSGKLRLNCPEENASKCLLKIKQDTVANVENDDSIKLELESDEKWENQNVIHNRIEDKSSTMNNDETGIRDLGVIKLSSDEPELQLAEENHPNEIKDITLSDDSVRKTDNNIETIDGAEDQYKWIKDLYVSVEKCLMSNEFCQNSEAEKRKMENSTDVSGQEKKEVKVPDKSVTNNIDRRQETEKWKGNLAATVLKIRQIKERLKSKEYQSFFGNEMERTQTIQNQTEISDKEKTKKNQNYAQKEVQHVETSSPKCNLNQTKKVCSRKKDKLEGNKEQKKKKKKNKEIDFIKYTSLNIRDAKGDPLLKKTNCAVATSAQEKVNDVGKEVENLEDESLFEPEHGYETRVPKINVEINKSSGFISELEVANKVNSSKDVSPHQLKTKEASATRPSNSGNSNEMTNVVVEKGKKKATKCTTDNKTDTNSQGKIMDNIVNEHGLQLEEREKLLLTSKTQNLKSLKVSHKQQRKSKEEESNLVLEERDHLARKVEQLSKLLNLLIVLTNGKNSQDQIESVGESQDEGISNSTKSNCDAEMETVQEQCEQKNDLKVVANVNIDTNSSTKTENCKNSIATELHMATVATSNNSHSDTTNSLEIRNIKKWKEQISTALQKLQYLKNNEVAYQKSVIKEIDKQIQEIDLENCATENFVEWKKYTLESATSSNTETNDEDKCSMECTQVQNEERSNVAESGELGEDRVLDFCIKTKDNVGLLASNHQDKEISCGNSISNSDGETINMDSVSPVNS